MKQGDQYPVSMAGYDIAYATIESVEDDRVFIRVPETVIEMGVERRLADISPEVDRDLASQVQTADTSSEASEAVDSASQSNSGASVPDGSTSSSDSETSPSDDISEVSLKDIDLDSSAVDKDDE